MPQLNEIQNAKQLGYRGHNKHIWRACIDCGKERWTTMSKHFTRCRSCANKFRLCGQRFEKSPNWKSGKCSAGQGYIQILLHPTDFFYPMAHTDGYVFEHRLVMAQHLGRCLQSWEIVHHKGIRYRNIENRKDNQIDNLELASSLGEHSKQHSQGYKNGYNKGLIDGRNKQIHLLTAEIERLKKESLSELKIFNSVEDLIKDLRNSE